MNQRPAGRLLEQLTTRHRRDHHPHALAMCIERKPHVIWPDRHVASEQFDSETVRLHFLDCATSVLGMSVCAEGQSCGAMPRRLFFSHNIQRTWKTIPENVAWTRNFESAIVAARGLPGGQSRLRE